MSWDESERGGEVNGCSRMVGKTSDFGETFGTPRAFLKSSMRVGDQSPRSLATMGTKRKAKEAQNEAENRAQKKSKREEGKNEKTSLIFAPKPDWHAAELPPREQRDVTTLPPQRTIDELHQYATTLLEGDNAAYNNSHLSGSSSHKFLSTIMSSGTLEDKVSALTLLVQESPLHTMKAFENLLGLAKKKSRNQALMAVAALKDLLAQGLVLPGDRKLRAFGKQPCLLSALQGKAMRWSNGEPLPIGLQRIHLVVWAFEDWLKRKYFELLQVLESWCGDEVEYARSRAVTYVWELLKDKPEQEENLLRLLVNKLGDTDRKIASRASYLLLQLEITHPAMKMVVTNSIESDCLFPTWTEFAREVLRHHHFEPDDFESKGGTGSEQTSRDLFQPLRSASQACRRKCCSLNA